MDKSVMRVVLAVAASFGGAMLLCMPAWTTAADSLFQRAETDLRGATEYVPGSCTIFAISRGRTVYFGNNEDWTFPKPIYWVEPPREGQYGSVYLGFNPFNAQGGVNEKGLAFDFNALPASPMKSHPELPRRPGPLVNILMQQAATVEEAIGILNRYDWGGTLAWQMLLADATGAAAVVGAGPDGELAFTRKPPDGFLVSTNFNRANPDTRLGGYPCPRYEKATEMLGRVRAESDLTVEALRAVVDAVHVEGPGINTLYSNVVDLKRRIIYLYYWHQYGEVVTLDVMQEIARRPKPTPLRDLFTRETVERAAAEVAKYKGHE